MIITARNIGKSATTDKAYCGDAANHAAFPRAIQELSKKKGPWVPRRVS
jgi:hypothetical protein